MRIAIIGCGGISRAHISAVKKLQQDSAAMSRLEKIVVVACYDPVEEKAFGLTREIAEFQQNKPRPYSRRLEEMLEKEAGKIDAAIICSPHYAHHTNAVACMKAGLHVLIEKPVAATISAAKQIQRVAAETGVVAAVAENWPHGYWPRIIVWHAKRKTFGMPIGFIAIQTTKAAPKKWSWRESRLLSGGGACIDSGMHAIASWLLAFGNIAEVYARMRFSSRKLHDAPAWLPHIPVEDEFAVMLRFSNNTQAFWNYARAAEQDSLFAEYAFSEVSLRDKSIFHPFDNPVIVFKKTQKKQQILKELEQKFFNLAEIQEDVKDILQKYKSASDSFVMQLYDFCCAVQNNRKPKFSVRDGIKHLAVALAAYESATTGKPVKPDDVIAEKVCVYQQQINEFLGIS